MQVTAPLKPCSTVGILGGGQLGRMLAMAAARLGLLCHVFAAEQDACAFQVVGKRTCADFSDTAALDAFAADCDVITFESENVPVEALSFLSARKPLLPNPAVLERTQDRLIEKNLVRSLAIETAPYAAVESEATLAEAIAKVGCPAVLKTRRFGYDGKGQAIIRDIAEAQARWRELQCAPCILERFVAFDKEISVIAARGRDGAIVSFDVTENEHRDHILKMSSAPADVPASVETEAKSIASRIADALDYVGVLAVEMFVVQRAGGPAVLVNEIAPRVHNSGHWTIDGATVSQFEQHIRAIAGWPLGWPVRHGRVQMINLIGAEAQAHSRWLGAPGVAVHLYGKGDCRPGRKMGHISRVATE